MNGFDTIVENQRLYSLTGDSSVVVIDLESSSGSEVLYSTVASETRESCDFGMEWRLILRTKASSGDEV